MRALTAALVGVLLGADPAAAFVYEAPIEVVTEADLDELLAAGEITPETHATLVDLLRQGVDLSTADRAELYALPGLTLAEVDGILAYRTAADGVRDPVDLVGAKVIPAERLLAIAPFLTVRPSRAPTRFPGRVRLPAVWAAGDDGLPALALQARATGWGHATLGLAGMVTRNQVGPAAYDEGRDALAAEGPAPRLAVPKGYVAWDDGDVQVVGGSYRAGFAERLTFDATDRETPDGIYPDAALVRSSDLERGCIEGRGELASAPCPDEDPGWVAPDFRTRAGLLGVAAAARRLPVAGGRLQLVGLLSAEVRSVYQYEIYDRGRCDDPRDDDDPACAAPVVVRRRDDGGPTSAYKYVTLPRSWVEPLAGLHVAWRPRDRVAVGATAYGARPRWLIEGIRLDFQEWARTPFGGGYGAIGVNAAWGRGWLDLAAEVTRSFDALPGGDGGGGWAAIGRAVASRRAQEVELTVRAYALGFDNPYAHPVSQPDEVDGQRARDEAGARVRWTGALVEGVRLRASADAWVQPSTGTPRLELASRADARLGTRASAAAWGAVSDRDVRASGRGACYEGGTGDDDGERMPCTGERWQLGARLAVAPWGPMRLAAQGRHAWVDDPRRPDGLRRDGSAWGSADARLAGGASVRTRLRWSAEGLDAPRPLHAIWGSHEVAARRGAAAIRVRYDHLVHRGGPDPDDPALAPRHWVLVELETAWR